MARKKKTIRVNRDEANRMFSRLLDDIEKINLGQTPSNLPEEEKTRLLREMDIPPEKHSETWTMLINSAANRNFNFVVLDDDFVEAWFTFKMLIPMIEKDWSGVTQFIAFIHKYRQRE